MKASINYDLIISKARNQTREATGCVLYVSSIVFKEQLYDGEAFQLIRNATLEVLNHSERGEEIQDDESFSYAYYAVCDVIADACIKIHELKYK